MSSKTDVELLEAFNAGDVEGYNELVERYQCRVYGLAVRILKHEEDAEEASQHAFLSLFRGSRKFEGRSAFSSWLFRITANEALQLVRRNRKHKEGRLEQIEMDGVVEQADFILNNNRFDQLRIEKTKREGGSTGPDDLVTRLNDLRIGRSISAAVAALPDQYRDVFIMRDIDGEGTGAVAKVLKMTRPAIKSRLHRARKIVKRKLRPVYERYCQDQSVKKAANG